MLQTILIAIVSASRPDSSVPVTQRDMHHDKRPPQHTPPYRKPMVRKKVRQWRGIFEHKDTPLQKF